MNSGGIQLAASKLQAAEKALLKQDEIISDIENQIKNKTIELDNNKKEYDTAIKGLDEASPNFMSLKDGIEKKQKPKEAEINQLNTNLVAVKIERDKLDSDAKSARAELEKFNGKTDAYSVFGSFDSESLLSVLINDKTEGGIKLGRMFSTGVAAQNISQGMAIKVCLETLKSMDIPKDKLTGENLNKLCGNNN